MLYLLLLFFLLFLDNSKKIIKIYHKIGGGYTPYLYDNVMLNVKIMQNENAFFLRSNFLK